MSQCARSARAAQGTTYRIRWPTQANLLRVGQKGRGARVWFERGLRPEGVLDRRYASAWIYAAVRPGTDQAFALVLAETSAEAMQAFLDRFAATLPEGVHAALLLDGAGWHIAAGIAVPANISLIFLPPYHYSATFIAAGAAATGVRTRDIVRGGRGAPR